MKEKIIRVRLDDDEFKILFQLSKINDCNLSEYVRDSLVMRFEKEEHKLKKPGSKILERIKKRHEQDKARKSMNDRASHRYVIWNCFRKIKDHAIKQYVMNMRIDLNYVGKQIDDVGTYISYMDDDEKEDLKEDYDILKSLKDEMTLRKLVFGNHVKGVELELKSRKEGLTK